MLITRLPRIAETDPGLSPPAETLSGRVFLNNPMRPSFYDHLHPPTIPAAQARWRYTLGMGGLAVFLALVVGFTGILVTFYYVPTPEQAAKSVQELAFLVPFGWLMRNLHYWSAQLLVLVMALHLLRVVFSGAYLPPRRLNYLLGLLLLVLCLFLDFTGYVLRWDTGVHWALVAGTNLVRSIPGIGEGLYAALVSGSQVGAGTLTRFYAWHLFGLTVVVIIILVWHLFRVRRDGGIAVPPPQARTDQSRIPRKELARREGLAMLWAGVVLITLAILVPAPLAPAIQQGTTFTEESLAPWFFLWVQQLLRLGDPFIFGVLIPLGALVLLALVPYITPHRLSPTELGHWFPEGGRIVQVLIAILTGGILLLTILTWINRLPGLGP
jgi:quinol-cytochrome oxidoreductase complex cytochrome b subunit